MPLDFQITTTPFRYGVDEGTDPKQVPPGTLTECKNLVWLKSGRLQKRQGVDHLATDIAGGGSIADAKRLFTRGDELCLVSEDTVYAWVNSTWISRGIVPNLGLTWSTALDTTTGIRAADVAMLDNGHMVHAWVTGDPTDEATGGDIYYQVIEQSTGATITPPTAIASPGPIGNRVRVVTDGTTYAVLWTNAGAGSLSSFVGGTTTALKTDASTASNADASFDACVIGSLFVVAYALDAGGIGLASYTFAATPVVQATGVVTGESSASIQAIGIDGASGETLYIGYCDVTNDLFRRAMANPSTLAQTVAPSTLTSTINVREPNISVIRTSSTTATYAWSFSDDDPSEPTGIMKSVHMTSAGTSYNASQTAFTRLLSKPFTVVGSTTRQYAIVGNFTTATDFLVENGIPGSDVYVADITVSDSSTAAPARLVGKLDVLVGGKWNTGHLANVAAVSGISGFTTVTPFQSSSATNLVGWRQGMRSTVITYDASLPLDTWRSVTIENEAYLSASVLTAYDGQYGLPFGFAHPAFIDKNLMDASGAGNLAAGAYIYNTVPERWSATGILHRGPTGIAITSPTVIGGSKSMVVPITVVSLSVSDQPESIALYRTAVNLSIPYRLSNAPSILLIKNEYTASPINVTDTYGDADVGYGNDISTRPVIYTQGGELDDYQPPAFVSIGYYRGRIFGIIGTEHEVWFSKNYASNPNIAPGFNPALRLLFADRCVAIAVLDERMFVFHPRAISYFSGDGPNLSGDASDYGEPNKLQTDVGCKTPRGVVSTPMGIIFVAGDDNVTEIHLLNRKLQVDWIGKRVQDLLAAYPVVTSAVLVSVQNHVRFTCNAADGGSGIVLVYDYQEDQWSHFTYLEFYDEGTSTYLGTPITDAILHKDVYTFATPDGDVYKESQTTSLDDGAYVPARAITAWIHAQGPAAYQSVRNLLLDGESLSAHGLIISVGFDGSSAFDQGPVSYPEGLAKVTSPDTESTLKVSIGPYRKCRSIRFKFEDTAPAILGTGQGAIWSTMGIELGIKKGPAKLAIASQK